MDVNPGFRADHLLVFDVIRSAPPGTESLNFFSEALDRISRLPGVKSASAAMCGPFGGTMWTSPYLLEGRPAPPSTQQPWTALNMVMPHYFETLDTPLIEGRFLSDSDRAASMPVAIVNQTMARYISPHGSAIGRQIRVRYAAHQLLEVVGVVADVKQLSLDKPDMPEVYLPASQMPVNFMTIAVRTSVEPGSLAHSAVLSIRALDKGQPVSNIVPLTAKVAAGLIDRKFVAFLLASFGALGLLLAATGVFGVIAYTAAQRTREIGVRLAIGARPAQVLKLILWQGMFPAFLGIAAGLGIAWEMTRLLAGMLFEVRPHDIPTFLGASLLLAATALAACFLPARRAMKVDPAITLRYE
jgi:putative ABC transport system permease protein